MPKNDKEHTHKLFLRTVETGLQDESIRVKLIPYLKDASIMDEDLIQELDAVVSSERERSRKLKSQHKACVKLSGQTSQVSPAKDNSDTVIAVIKVIKSEVESLCAEMTDSKTSNETRQRNRRVQRKPLRASCQ